MDGFRILKFVHFARDHFYENVKLPEALDWLFRSYLELDDKPAYMNEILSLLRDFDRKVS